MQSWINESIFYHIYPLGYCGCSKHNDGVQSYSLDKLYDSIPHLKELSVNAMYIGPVFESSYHGYDTKDYLKIDSRLGDNASFKKLCNELHSNGIKVVLDGVFNHVGREFWAFKDIQENLQNSKYCSWFENLNFGGQSPKGDPFWYEGWSGHFDLVKLNLKNPDVTNHLLTAVGMWMDEFGIDGIRLDAADCVDPDFFKALHNYTKNKRPDFWLMGEIIHGDYTYWANPEMLDSVTNYECYKGLYSSHNDHNYFEIAHSLQRQFGDGGLYRHLCLYNFSDNHDVNRLASNSHSDEFLGNIYTILYTMPGVPSIYYGSEWGIKGRRSDHSDYELRPCITLHDPSNGSERLFSQLKKLGAIRRQLNALKYGRFHNVNIKNEQYVYKRQTEGQTVYVMLNVNPTEQWIDFNVDGQGKLTDVLNNNETFDVNGYANLPIPGNSSRILVFHNGDFNMNFEFEKPKTNSAANSIADNTEKIIPTEVKIGQRYRHFKGAQYIVKSLAIHSETGEKLVVYEDVLDPAKTWARPYDMFIQAIEVDGKRKNRFQEM